MVKRIGIGILAFGFVLFMGTAAQAVPSLGIGGELQPCTNGYYTCFTGNSASGSGESFALPGSGGTVNVWSSITGADIWLVAEDSLEGITVNGMGGDDLYINKLTGYQGNDPYSAVNLGPVNTSDGWVSFADGEFASGTFYRYQATLEYNGTNPIGDWLFVVADTSGDGLLTHPFDVVSPKTTSMVPEPGTLLLLGSGLIGLGIYRRKFKP